MGNKFGKPGSSDSVGGSMSGMINNVRKKSIMGKPDDPLKEKFEYNLPKVYKLSEIDDDSDLEIIES